MPIKATRGDNLRPLKLRGALRRHTAHTLTHRSAKYDGVVRRHQRCIDDANARARKRFDHVAFDTQPSAASAAQYTDGPGCYVILIFNHEVENAEWDAFDDGYIGQPVNMRKRIHAHFNGKGNGNV